VSAAARILLLSPKGTGVANTVLPSHDYEAPLTPVIDTQITGVAGTWTGNPTITHQWQRNNGAWADISGATNINYTPTDSDFGLTLRRLEIPDGDTGAAVASAATGAVMMTGLQLWLDASDADTLFQDSAGTTPATADNDPVGYWADKSGNGNHATQATTSAKPALKLAIQNGRNVVRFTTDDVLTIGDKLDMRTNNILVFVVGKKAGVGATAETYFAKSRLASESGRYALIYASGSLNAVYAHTSGGEDVVVARTGGSYEVVAQRINRVSGANRLYANGAQIGSDNAFTPDTGTDHNTTFVSQLGAYRDASDAANTLFLTGDEAEVLVFHRATEYSAGEVAAIFSYLNAKWAVY
jgi:hypothetical protein